MELPLVKDNLAPSSIRVGSEQWFTWLATIKSFRYQPSEEGYTYLRWDITVRNRTKDYWYAYRKVNGMQRTYYLGKTQDLDYEKLQQAVDELSLNDAQYHKLVRERKAGVQTADRDNVYTSDKAAKEISTLQEKYNLLQLAYEELQLESKLLKERLITIQEVVKVAQEVVDSIIPSKSNMIRGTGLVKLRDKLNSIQ
jgi:hypothetical protein